MSMAQNEGKQPTYEGWSILELFGHRRLAGYVKEVELGGAKVLRIDVPKAGEPEGSTVWHATQFYGGSALYCLTPTTESMARRTAALNQPEPVTRWELPAETRARAADESDPSATIDRETKPEPPPDTIDGDDDIPFGTSSL